MANKSAKTDKVSFEHAMTRLHEISVSMNSDDLPLEEAVRLYSEASGLIQICRGEMENAQLTLNELFGGGNA